MAKKITNKKMSLASAQKIGIGVGLTAAAVAAVGAYFLYGSEDATKNRKKVKGWALKAKGEVLEALEKAEQMTEEEFQRVVDKVLMTYNKAQTLSKKELKEFKTEMVENWSGLLKSGVVKVLTADQLAKRIEKRAAAKKAAKKVAVSAKAAAPVEKVAPAKKVVAVPAKKAVIAKKITK